MKACVIRGARDLAVEERAAPEPSASEVVIRLGAGGICGSDLHYFAEGGVGDFKLREPMILGHEAAGVVARIGPSVRSVKVGDRVAVNPNQPCGACPQCLAGRRNLCRNVRFFGSAARFPHVNGVFAELFLAPEENCHAIPDGLSFRAPSPSPSRCTRLRRPAPCTAGLSSSSGPDRSGFWSPPRRAWPARPAFASAT